MNSNYYFISYQVWQNGAQIATYNALIDFSPLLWQVKNKTISDKNQVKECVLINWIQITFEQHLAFKDKFNS